MRSYIGLSGKKYTVGDVLSSESTGAEGEIRSVINDSNLVAKIYFEKNIPTYDSELEDKLKLMIKKNVIEQGQAFSIAWPRDLLYEEKNGKKSFVGYTMRRIYAKYNLFDLIHLDSSNPIPGGISGSINWKGYIQAAYNLSCIVEHLHANGIEIGDFNERNFLFDDRTGALHLIDCGTYGIFDTSTYKSIFPCRYSMPQYTAPERLLNIKITDPRYTDYFYLAITIFLLLMDNSDPFGYKENSDGDPLTKRQEHIINGECLYVRDIPGKVLRKHAIKPGVLPDDILEAFSRSFNYTKETVAEKIKIRTTATEWCNIFEKYLKDATKLIRCSNNREHVYSSHLSKCPWCNPASVSDNSFEMRLWERFGGDDFRFTDDDYQEAKKNNQSALEKKTAADIARERARAAKEKIDERKKVESVIKLIDSIGVVTYSEESNRRIRKARSAYRDLSIDQRTQVSTFKLSKAEAEYEELKNKAESKKKKHITSLAILAALCIVGIVISLISISLSNDKSAVQSSTAITESNASALKTSYTISPAEEYLNNSISAFNAGLSQGKYKQVAFGGIANYCLNRDGTIEVFANDLELDKTLEKAYSTWTDVDSICIMYKYGKKDETVFGIRKDGTVIAPTGDMFAECDVSNWKNIVKLDASLGYLLAITSDGTVLSSINIKGWNGTQYKCNCKEIACFQTKDDEVIGVTKAGKIISIMPKSNSLMRTYQNKKWEDRISKWKNVKDIVVGKYDWNVYGLMKDGTVKYGGSFAGGFSANDNIDDKERDIAKWKNITAITEGYMHLVALDSKGNVYASGDNKYGECNVSGWKNITRIEAFYSTTVGYDSDGRIYYTGWNCLDESLKKLHSETAVKESTETT